MTRWSERGGPAVTGTVEVGRHALRLVGDGARPRDLYFEEIVDVRVERHEDSTFLLVERETGGDVRISGDGLQEIADALSHLQVTVLAV